MEEKVDILIPPKFGKSGKIKPRSRAWKNEDWIGTFNLWIIQDIPEPSIIYQLRNPNLPLGANKLDVSVGGHYQAGESMKDGLREVHEEIGRDYDFKQLTLLGRRVYIAPDINKNMRHNIVDVFMILDNSSLDTFKLEKDKIYAIFSLPIDQLIKVNEETNYSFEAKGLDNKGQKILFTVKKDSFPYNFDRYHHKILHIAKRFLNKEKGIIF